jgi:hypothetical protein
VHSLHLTASVLAVPCGGCYLIALSDIVEIGIAIGIEIGALLLVKVPTIAPAAVLELADWLAVIYRR